MKSNVSKLLYLGERLQLLLNLVFVRNDFQGWSRAESSSGNYKIS